MSGMLTNFFLMVAYLGGSIFLFWLYDFMKNRLKEDARNANRKYRYYLLMSVSVLLALFLLYKGAVAVATFHQYRWSK